MNASVAVGSPANQLRFEFNSVGIITYSIFIIMLHAVCERRERDVSSNNHESLHDASFLGNSNFSKGKMSTQANTINQLWRVLP